MITLLAFVGAIALLVVFHEFGHYWVARRCGVKVLRFSLGFGNVIYSKRFANSDTEWVISAIPLGGYVKMLDEREEEVAPGDLPYAFNRKPVLQRMAIVVARAAGEFSAGHRVVLGFIYSRRAGAKTDSGRCAARHARCHRADAIR